MKSRLLAAMMFVLLALVGCGSDVVVVAPVPIVKAIVSDPLLDGDIEVGHQRYHSQAGKSLRVSLSV